LIVSDKIYIRLSEIENHVSNICNMFTYPNPEYHRNKKLKLSVRKISPSLKNYKFQGVGEGRMLILPRGCLSKLKDYFKNNNMFVRVLDDRIEHPPIDCKLKETNLEPQQHQLINAFVNDEGGLVEALPGAGKTIGILGLIDTIKQPTIILMHEEGLQKQWIKEIKKRMKGNFVLGRWDGNHKTRGDIDVGLVQTVHKQVDLNPNFLDSYGMIVLDEAHHGSAATFLKTLNSSRSKYRVGVTGTVERKDQMHILLYDVIGKVLLVIKDKDLKHRITPFEYEMVNTNISIELPTNQRWVNKKRVNVLNPTGTITLLTKIDKRNTMIINNIINDIEIGHFPLVLSDRVDHITFLDYRLNEMGYNSILIKGGATKKSEKINWDEIREDTTIQVICASTKKAEEGLDLPRLSSLHLTCMSSNYPKFKQKIGRIRRKLEGKPTPKVYYYVDNLAYIFELSKDTYVKKHILSYTAKNVSKYFTKLQDEYYEEK